MAEDLPPVTFGVRIVDINPAHVRLTLFAGEHPDARGMAGSLTLRRAEYAEFIDRLRPELVLDPTGQPVPEVCCCSLVDVSLPGGPPEYVRGHSNGCRLHPVPGEVSDAEARRKARE